MTNATDTVPDPVADQLDVLAALAQHWIRNRERGITSEGIRGAMLLVAQELLAREEVAMTDMYHNLFSTTAK